LHLQVGMGLSANPGAPYTKATGRDGYHAG
jgi:hypothetical protein